jgi:hypothetical protein
MGLKKLEISKAQPPLTCPSNGSACNKNHLHTGTYINHRCIGSFMYKSPRVTLSGCKGLSLEGFRAHTAPPAQLSNITVWPLPLLQNLLENKRKL